MGGYDTTVEGNTERSYHPSWGSEKVYQCPRGIFLHSGNADACRRACEKAKGENGDDYIERDVLRTLIVAKKVIFNGMGCVGKLAQSRNVILTYHKADNLSLDLIIYRLPVIG